MASMVLKLMERGAQCCLGAKPQQCKLQKLRRSGLPFVIAGMNSASSLLIWVKGHAE